MMTIVIPIATIMVAALLMIRSRKLPDSKNEGAMIKTAMSKNANAKAAEISRLYFSTLKVI